MMLAPVVPHTSRSIAFSLMQSRGAQDHLLRGRMAKPCCSPLSCYVQSRKGYGRDCVPQPARPSHGEALPCRSQHCKLLDWVWRPQPVNESCHKILFFLEVLHAILGS